MKPQQGLRRAIIREWMAVPPNKRKTVDHAATFADQVIVARKLQGSDDRQRVLTWLAPRMGKA